MSTGVVAAGAAAFALYVYLKQKALQDGSELEPVVQQEVSRNAPDHAPSSWGEAFLHVKEVLRYMFNETLGRWHTIDLFVGLAYLSHREALEYPAADLAAQGAPVLTQDISMTEQLKLLLELQEARRYMLYCKGMKLRREEMQLRFWKEHLGADTLSLIKQQPTAGVLRPAYVVVSDRALRCIVLCIRGTHSTKDLFTSLAGTAKPHHVVDPDVPGGLVLGYSHLGMLAAARWLAKQVTPLLRLALAAHPGYQLRVVGHSMGGGTAVLLTMMLRSGVGLGSGGAGPAPTPSDASTPHAGPSSSSAPSPSPSPSPSPGPSAPAPSDDALRSARCVAIACPCLVTLELAVCCREYVTSIMNGTDIVPTFCAATVDRLREDVTRSSWFTEFSRDMRSGVVRALQGGVRGVGSATQWTSRNILQPTMVPFRACYTTTRRTKRRATAAALPTSPLHAAEQHEQLLLAAGAGGGSAAAAAAAAAVAALEAGGPLSPTSSAAALAALTGMSMPPPMPSAPEWAPQAMSMSSAAGGLDPRAMAGAVQSCMYAVGSAVSAHQHQQYQHSPADPAMTEALGMLESLPPGLGPPRGSGSHTHPHHHHRHSRQPSGGAGASGSGGATHGQEGEHAGSLLGPGGGGGGGAVFGGGVSTAMSYGSSLRRRLWPWGQGQGQDGPGFGGGAAAGGGLDGSDSLSPTGAGGGLTSPLLGPSSRGGGGGGLPTSTLAAAGAGGHGSASAAAGPIGQGSDHRRNSSDGSGGGGGGMSAPGRVVPDSPGKAKAAAVGLHGGGAGAGGGASTSRGFGDWLWRGSGMLFNTCTAPRRPLPATSGQLGGAAAAGLGSDLGDLGLGGGRRPTEAAGGGRGTAGRQRSLRMDVGDVFDDESDDGAEELEAEGGSVAGEGDLGDLEDEEEEEEGPEDEEEEELERLLGGEAGGAGGALAGGGGVDSEQQLQAGITAVVAAVTNQACREAEGAGGLLQDETTRAAEDVLREVGDVPGDTTAAAAAAAAAAVAAAQRRRNAGARRSIGRNVNGSAAGGSTARSASMPRGVSSLGSGGDGGGSAGPSGGVDIPGAGGASAGGARGLPRVTSDAGAAMGRGGGAGGGVGGEDDEGYGGPLSPGGLLGSSPGADSPTPGSSNLRAGINADYEARLYKRRLYPAGRILHLFPAAALPSTGTAAGTDGGDGGISAVAVGAATTPADMAAVRSSAAAAPYVVLEMRDPQSYSRVRLCRTMVSDHLIPAYLTSLESIVGQLEEMQEKTARAAWERQEESDMRRQVEREQQQQQQQEVRRGEREDGEEGREERDWRERREQ